MDAGVDAVDGFQVLACVDPYCSSTTPDARTLNEGDRQIVAVILLYSFRRMPYLIRHRRKYFTQVYGDEADLWEQGNQSPCQAYLANPSLEDASVQSQQPDMNKF